MAEETNVPNGEPGDEADASAEIGQEESTILRTHQRIDPRWSGELVAQDRGHAKVVLETQREMVADEMGLVHGGFIFAAADYAAMAAVNEPTVVLASSECRFLSPVAIGDKVVFEATELQMEGRKRRVHVTGYLLEVKVFEGEFMTVVLERHVLKLKLLNDEERGA